MIKAGAALSREPPAERAARQAGEAAMRQGGLTRADLVVAFATTHYSHEYPVLLSTLSSVTGAENIVGCSGIGVLGPGIEVEGSISLAVLAIEGIRPAPFLVTADENSPQNVVQGVLDSLPSYVAPGSTLLLLTDTLHVDAAYLVQALQEGLKEKIPVVGGAASGMNIPLKTFQWAGDQITDQGISGVLLGEGLRSHIGVAQGCEPVGQPYIITHAKDNIVFGIGNRPATEILHQTLESLPPDKAERAAGSIFAGLVIDERKYPLEQGDFLVRNLVGLDYKYGAIALASRVSVGQTIQFQIRDAQAARTALLKTLQRLSEEVGKDTPSFGLYFNCLGRGQGLYGVPSHDIEVIRAFFPSIPIAGFFTNGELGPVGKRNLFHNYSGVLALFRPGGEGSPA